MIMKLEKGIDQQRVRTYLTKAQQQLQQDKKYGAVQIYYDVDPL
jgi:primosomal protein N' (replication factor Y)